MNYGRLGVCQRTVRSFSVSQDYESIMSVSPNTRSGKCDEWYSIQHRAVYQGYTYDLLTADHGGVSWFENTKVIEC